MENKTKKTKVDDAAIISECEMFGRGRSHKQFCDDNDHVYPNVLRYYRKCFWNSKSKLVTSPEGDKSLVPLEIEPAEKSASASPMVETDKPNGMPAALLGLGHIDKESSQIYKDRMVGNANHFALLYTKINVKSDHFLFLTSSESPLNKGGSEGVWKYRWLLKMCTDNAAVQS